MHALELFSHPCLFWIAHPRSDKHACVGEAFSIACMRRPIYSYVFAYVSSTLFVCVGDLCMHACNFNENGCTTSISYHCDGNDNIAELFSTEVGEKGSAVPEFHSSIDEKDEICCGCQSKGTYRNTGEVKRAPAGREGGRKEGRKGRMDGGREGKEESIQDCEEEFRLVEDRRKLKAPRLCTQFCLNIVLSCVCM